MKKTTKVFKLEDSILIVTAKTEGCGGRPYVSVTASTIRPVRREDAEAQVMEQLEDGEHWRMAVESKSTELGLEQWIELVIKTDGPLSGFDNSLYTRQLTIDGEEYIFESESCGCLHDDIMSVTSLFNGLIKLHLKDTAQALKKAEAMIAGIPSDNTDLEVERYTRELISVNA